MLESQFKPRQGLNATPTFSFHTSFIFKDGWGAVSSKQVTVKQKEPVWVPKVSRLRSHPFLENVNQKGLSPPPKLHPHAHAGFSRLQKFSGFRCSATSSSNFSLPPDLLGAALTCWAPPPAGLGISPGDRAQSGIPLLWLGAAPDAQNKASSRRLNHQINKCTTRRGRPQLQARAGLHPHSRPRFSV